MKPKDLPNKNLPDGFWIDEAGVSFERFLCEWGESSVFFKRRKGVNLGIESVFIGISEILKAFEKPLRFGDREQIYALKSYQAISVQKELSRGDYSIFR